MRSPTPPTEIVPHNRGTRYTEADKDFLCKTIRWELRKDPSCSRKAIQRVLAEKVRLPPAVARQYDLCM